MPADRRLVRLAALAAAAATLAPWPAHASAAAQPADVPPLALLARAPWPAHASAPIAAARPAAVPPLALLARAAQTPTAPTAESPAPAESVPVTAPPPAPSPTPAPSYPPPPTPPPPRVTAPPAPAPRSAAPPTASTPPPRDTYATAQAIEARTGLDLSGVWQDYARAAPRDQRFLDFAHTKFRRKLVAGIGLSLSGLALLAAGTVMVVVTAERADVDPGAEVDLIGATLVITAGAALAIPGAILWPINQVRLHKLRRAYEPPALGLRLRPLALRRGGGLGVSLAF